MSNVPISSLPLTPSIDGSEFVPMVQGGTTKRTTIAAISTFPASDGSFVMATSTPLLTGSRLLSAQTGVTTITDGGPLGDITVGIATNGIGNAQIRQGAALSVVGNSGTATANVADIAGIAGQVLRVNDAGTALGFGSVDLSQSASVGTSILKVANGGTGLATTTPFAVVAAGTTSTGNFQQVSGLGAGGQVLTSAGASALPVWANNTPAIIPTSISNANSPYTVLSTDTTIFVTTSGGAVTIDLMASASRGNLPLTIVDVSGNAAANNITISPNGADTNGIAGHASLTVKAAYGGYRLYPDSSNLQYVVAP
jgi:hypothetical protein